MEADLEVARNALADAQRSIAQARAEVDEARQVHPSPLSHLPAKVFSPSTQCDTSCDILYIWRCAQSD